MKKRHNCKTFLETLANLNPTNLQWSPRDDETTEMMYNDLDHMHEMISQFFQIGRSMFIMAIQYLMARDLMCHPELYRIIATDRIINDFKQALSVPALFQMLSTTCAHATIPSHHNHRRRQRLIEAFLMSSEEQLPLLQHPAQHCPHPDPLQVHTRHLNAMSA